MSYWPNTGLLGRQAPFMTVASLPWFGVSHVTMCDVLENGATRSVMASVLII